MKKFSENSLAKSLMKKFSEKFNEKFNEKIIKNKLFREKFWKNI
jgi:hypothetical protein